MQYACFIVWKCRFYCTNILYWFCSFLYAFYNLLKLHNTRVEELLKPFANSNVLAFIVT